MTKIESFEELKETINQQIKLRNENEKTVLIVSAGTCGRARGSLKVIESLNKVIKEKKLEGKIQVKSTGCHGFCEAEPNIIIHPQNIFYQHVQPKDAESIITETALNNKIIDKLLYSDPVTGQVMPKESDISFYAKQKRIVMGDNALIDPTDINDYFAIGGYNSLGTVLKSRNPEDVIKTITASGIRGRGGAGFPTGSKWKFARDAKGDIKYIICNADEGDPGAYMDRSLMEGNPHRVLEGMIIGAYAIGATEGYIYVRMEYPLALKNITIALEQARKLGLLGDAILGSEFNFDVHVFKGAGSFVSGEETSLMASIEGRRAQPRQRPPFPAQSGLWGKPTNINNVETWGNIPIIIDRGSEWFAGIGTESSKGTKIFSLVGKINNTGLVEVPMGITLREIIYDIGGGIPGDKEFKAIQTGGPSGGCIPKEKLDLPVDYKSLSEAGSIMGSGGMIVMDEDTCMVDVARYFLQFTQEESCGKCVPCRIGTRQMVEILSRITKGEGRESDIKKLEELAKTIKAGSLCGLGQTSPNPVLTTLRYFRKEYEDHIYNKSCKALACKDLICYYIEPDKCVGCLLCKKSCPVDAISGKRKEVHVIDHKLCIKCGACFDVCPSKIRAVSKYTGEKKEKILKKASAGRVDK